MPFYPDPKQDNEGVPYDTPTYWDHVIAQYAGCSMRDVLELDIVSFLSLRREAFIVQMSQTKDGREYLSNAHAFESEEMDEAGHEKLKRMLEGRR